MSLTRSGLAAVLAGFVLGCSRANPARPDVLLIVIDTLRADRLPFHDSALDTAPFLKELAARSVVFERAWSPSSWTGPATASLFTGVAPRQHGVHTNLTTLEKRATGRPRVNRIPAALETLPEFLRGLGYRTFAVTDNPNIVPELGFGEGFEHFANFDYEGAARVNAALGAWRDEIRAAQPWFVYLHYMDPHVPYHRRAPWFRAAAEGAGERAEKLAAYDSEIAYVDEHLRAVFELLDVDEDTLVIFTADHGEEFGEHGGWNHLFQLYNELTHVPLLVRQPGVQPLRARVSADVSLLDVLPTLRSILGTPPSLDDAGRDLTPYYLGSGPNEERVLAGQRRTASAEKEYVLHGRHKLIVTRPQDRHELYDLAADPGETRNLAAERPELVAELLRRLQELHRSTKVWEREMVELELGEDDLRRLEELGYAGEGEESEAGGR